MPDEITIDGMAEEEFRRSIETMLRSGQADEAAIRLKALVVDHAGEDKILAERFLTISSDEITLGGWDRLTEQLNQYDRPEVRITAIGVDIADPEDAGVWPDADGNLSPCIETSFFSDSAYPFSVMDREDLQDGYTMYGCEWQGNYDQADSTLSVLGIDDLYGSITSLEMEVSQYEEPPAEAISAGALGACYLAVLIHLAVRDAALKLGLPRPLCLLVGSNNAYPFFDSPVLTIEEYVAEGSVKHEPEPVVAASDEGADEELQPAEMASLESLTMPRKKVAKKMALVMEGAGEDYSPIPEDQIISEPTDAFVGLTELDDSPVQAKSLARISLSEMISTGEKAPPLFVKRNGDGKLAGPTEIHQPEFEPLDMRQPDGQKTDRISAEEEPVDFVEPVPEGDDQPDIADDSPPPEEIQDSDEGFRPLEPKPNDAQPGFGVDLFADGPEAPETGDETPVNADMPDGANHQDDTDESNMFELLDEANLPDANLPDPAPTQATAPEINDSQFELLGLRIDQEAPASDSAFDNPLAAEAQAEQEHADEDQAPVISAAQHPLRAGIVVSPPKQPHVAEPRSEAVWRQLLPTFARWADALTQNRIIRRIGNWFG